MFDYVVVFTDCIMSIALYCQNLHRSLLHYFGNVTRKVEFLLKKKKKYYLLSITCVVQDVYFFSVVCESTNR